MKITFETECGEKTCAAKPGQFCKFFGVKNFGQTPWCRWFDVQLADKDGWTQRCTECLATANGGTVKKLRNRYVSVIVNGLLDVWTGPNPDKDPTARKQAWDRAAAMRSCGHTAYPVLIEEITEKDLK